MCGVCKKIIKTLAVVASVATFALGVTTCKNNIGLGESVDTEAPGIKVTYPAAASIIKDSFVLSGTCSDDLKISSVKIVITNADTKKTYSYDASVTKSETWTATINEAKDGAYPLPDGLNYTATATAYDDAGHSTSDKLSFVIDNTAPVLILSSPAKTGSEDPTTYGRTLKLAGDFSDDNTVSSLDLYLKEYDSNTQTLSDTEKHISVSGITGMSSDNPLIVAKYYSATDAANDGTKTSLRNNYISLYGDVSDSTNEDKTFYCRIVLTDNAMTYKTSGDSGISGGNATSVYYINNDNFANNLLSEQTYNLTASKLRDILKGEDAGYTDDQISAIKTYLATSGYYASSTTIDKSSSSVISINPDNNPSYYASSLEISDATQTSTGFNTFTSGSTLYLSLAAGRDRNYVVPSSVSAKLYKLSSATDTDISDTAADDIITLLNVGDWTDEAGLNCNTSFVINAANYPKLESQAYYKLVVVGNDRASVALEPANDNGYGFKLKVAGNPPILSVGKRTDTTSLVNVKDSEYVNSSALKFSGSVSSETNTISSVTYKVVITDEDDATVSTFEGNSASGDGVFDSTSESWSFAIADNSSYSAIASGKEYKYTITITATDDNSSTATETRRINIDTKVPVVEISSVSPLAGSSDDCVNGTITVQGSISESYKSAAVLTVSDGTTTNKIDIGSYDSFKKTVDTTAYTDKAKLTLTLVATDKSGNESSSETTTSNIPTLSYTIDQSTDAPEFGETPNFTNGVAAADITASVNLFDTSTAGSKLTAQIIDDDSLSSITYKIYSYNTSTSAYDTEVTDSSKTISSINKSLYNLTIQLPSTEGKYLVVITAKDTKKETSCGTSTTLASTHVAVDSGIPSITLNKSSGAFVTTNPSLTITAKDSAGVVKIERYALTYNSSTETYALGELESTIDSTGSTVSSGINANDKITTSSGSIGDLSLVLANTITTTTTGYKRYVAYDKYGRTNSADFGWKIDVNAPTFTVAKAGGETYAESTDARVFYQGGTYQITGTVKDDESAAGGDASQVAGMYYKIATTAPAGSTYYTEAKTEANGWYSSSLKRDTAGTANGDVATWTAYVSGSSLTENTSYTVYLAAVDNAGYVSTISANPSAKIIVLADNTNPVFSVKINNTTTASGLAATYQKGSIDVTGTLTELHNSTFSVTTSKSGDSK